MYWLVFLTIGMAIGVITGSFITDEYWKERIEDERTIRPRHENDGSL